MKIQSLLTDLAVEQIQSMEILHTYQKMVGIIILKGDPLKLKN